MRRIDVEREAFSGRMLAVATQGAADLTRAVEAAAEPVIEMLKVSCTRGTKSPGEIEQFGRIAEASLRAL